MDPTEAALFALVRASAAQGHALSTSLQGWVSGVPVCEWEGVTCHEGESGGPAGSVAEVSLEAKGLMGTIPTELGLLQELEHLILKNNLLEGTIPQEIANLPKLITLDLTECFLTGTLPQRFASPNLTTLSLANNAISGRFFQTDDAPHLQSVKEIRMENNQLTGTLHAKSMLRMPRLETLSLSANDLSGLIPGEELGSLPGMKYLYLDSNHFVGPLPGQLAQVGRAQILELWVQDNALSGTVPTSYVRFDQMHDFFIDGNKLTGALPPELCGPEINADFFQNVPPEAERNYCDSIACPAGSVAFEGVYPCQRCPGGEAARLKNRYLGQTGKCSDYSQRDVLKLFYQATTKGGPWNGVSDWADEEKPVCEMTGITCDAHGNVVEIMLKNRHLEGHIPDEIGSLPFLESLDVSDNILMGYVPSDLKWTSLTNLDLSGNRIKGIVPPLLCMMGELNGNGEDNIFYCDRVACPAGTYNEFGFHHGVEGQTCEPCYDDTPFIGQKACRNTHRPPHFFEIAKDTSDQMGVSPAVGVGIFFGVSALLVALCWLTCFCMYRQSPHKKYARAHGSMCSDESSDDESDLAMSDQVYSYNDEEEESKDAANYPLWDESDKRQYRDTPASVISDEDEAGEESNVDWGDAEAGVDDSMSRTTNSSHRSATEFISENQGMALTATSRLKKAVTERVPEDLGRRAREVASGINVGARRLSARRKPREGMMALSSGSYEYGDVEEDDYDDRGFRADLELVKNSPPISPAEGSASSTKQLQPSDLLDIPTMC
ncbi:hypothetical protein ACHAXT_001902 [Thalassiosira profunda]